MSEQRSKEWLQKLKDESWEAELLVAAISIFGTLQMFVFIEWVTAIFINILPQSFYLVAYFVVFSALLAISILASMFIIHFMLRAYWVGLVGLNSVFSDYSIDDSQDTKLYMKLLVEKLPTLDHSINRADNLCSVIFSAAFGFLMAYGWIFFSSAVFLFIANMIKDYVPAVLLFLPVVILVLLIVTQMVVLYICSLKRHRQSMYWHNFYTKVSIIISIYSYGPLYKAILQISSIFSSNFKHDKALVKLVLLFVFCGFCLAGVKLISTDIPYLIAPEAYHNPTKAEPRYYQNQGIGETFLIAPQINNNVIESRVIEVFIPVYSSERSLYKKQCDELTSLDDPKREERRLAELACYEQYHKITVNGQVTTYNMIKTDHTNTNQSGIMAYVRIPNDFENGYYKIEIRKTIYDESRLWDIPFYYVND